MRETDCMSFDRWKRYFEKKGMTVVDTEHSIDLIVDDRTFIRFNKQTMNYSAVGFGSPLSFTTYPIYEEWRSMIKAWIDEQRKNQHWQEEEE